jgi:VWFA-related protein
MRPARPSLDECRRLLRVSALLLFLLGAAGSAQQPSFRAGVESVAVDVSVRSDGKPVAGLTAADFRLTDNGAVQSILDLSRESLPVDVTFVADLSGSQEGPRLGAFRRAIDAALGRLQPGDRAALVLFDPQIREYRGLEQSKQLSISVAEEAGGGATALRDAVAMSLVSDSDASRRRMVIVFTDGRDAGSFLDEGELLTVAGHSGVTVFVVALTDGTTRVPQPASNPGLLRALTETTGGTLAVVQRDQDINASFVQALDDFRLSYVLRYTPTSRSAGWHDVAVSLTRRGRFDVRARRGYFVH